MTSSQNSNKNVHRAGFISIVGKPNVGKSTLMNALMGEKLSITTPKAQTTRHRIMGILSGENYQLVYSDTPGLLDPRYPLQERMMRAVRHSLEDADLILVVVDLEETMATTEEYWDELVAADVPMILIVNKIDLGKGSQVHDKVAYWKEALATERIIPVSALTGVGVSELFELILKEIPEHPAYFPKDELSDKPERFFASEIIRENLFELYRQEVPYSTEVVVTEFKEEEHLIRMRAELYVERQSQKGILIGKKGSSLKTLGIEARKDLEAFFHKQVYLETFVKVEKDWRKRNSQLRRFGYEQ